MRGHPAIKGQKDAWLMSDVHLLPGIYLQELLCRSCGATELQRSVSFTAGESNECKFKWKVFFLILIKCLVTLFSTLLTWRATCFSAFRTKAAPLTRLVVKQHRPSLCCFGVNREGWDVEQEPECVTQKNLDENEVIENLFFTEKDKIMFISSICTKTEIFYFCNEIRPILILILNKRLVVF